MENLTNNPILLSSLNFLGFVRKNKNVIRRTTPNVHFDLFITYRQDISIHTKYYDIGIQITYREVARLKKKRNLYSGIPEGISVNIGYLMPEQTYIEFPVSDVDGLQMVSAVNRIFLQIKQYAIPFMEKYEDPNRLIEDYANGVMSEHIHLNKQMIALLYFIYKGKEKALNYVQEQLIQLKKEEPQKPTVSVEDGKFANMDSVTVSVRGNELILWEDLYEKLKH